MTSGAAAPAIVTSARTVDGRSLAGLAKTVQTGLARTIRPGKPLGIWIDEPVDFAACVIGALAVRAEAFIILPGASPARAKELCAIEGASAVLCDATRASRLVGGMHRVCAPGLVLVETQSQSPAGYHDPNCHGQGAVHFYTSGTDGKPKGVVRTKRSLELEESTVGSHLRMGPGCSVLCAVPVSHGYGYTAGLFAPPVVRWHSDRGAPEDGCLARQLVDGARARDRGGCTRSICRVVSPAKDVRRTIAASLVVWRSTAAASRTGQVPGSLGKPDRRAVRDD